MSYFSLSEIDVKGVLQKSDMISDISSKLILGKVL
jgi:hypothetical protein